ncbi:MAG: hypothetical protein IPP10_00920 [Candidatus Competibacteraceae bacterium]|nr:hypothetical protein [Candidatus Competibacteraceae bacterium]
MIAETRQRFGQTRQRMGNVARVDLNADQMFVESLLDLAFAVLTFGIGVSVFRLLPGLSPYRAWLGCAE